MTPSSWILILVGGWLVGDLCTRRGVAVAGAVEPSPSSSSPSLGSPFGSSSWGYPELVLPSADDVRALRGTQEYDDGGDENNNPRARSVPAVLHYVSPRVRQLRLLRDPSTGRDTFLPPPEVEEMGRQSPPAPPWDPRTVRVRDGRHGKLRLDPNGFELVTLAEGKRQQTIDLDDPTDVSTTYYPLCESLVRDAWETASGNHTTNRSEGNSSRNRRRGNNRVVVWAFDHNVRHSEAPYDIDDNDEESCTRTTTALPPAGIVHNDYTSVSAPRRLEQLASHVTYCNDAAATTQATGIARPSNQIPAHWVQEALQGRRRYAFVNVWRSVDPHHPVRSFPLALMDAQFAHIHNDVKLLQIHYVDRVGENYVAAFHPDHVWYYFPNLHMNEAILIKQWDSWGDLCHRRRPRRRQPEQHERSATSSTEPVAPPISTFALHTAFACPPPESCLRRLPPRKSIEVRCLCTWEDVEADEDEADH